MSITLNSIETWLVSVTSLELCFSLSLSQVGGVKFDFCGGVKSMHTSALSKIVADDGWFFQVERSKTKSNAAPAANMSTVNARQKLNDLKAKQSELNTIASRHASVASRLATGLKKTEVAAAMDEFNSLHSAVVEETTETEAALTQTIEQATTLVNDFSRKAATYNQIITNLTEAAQQCEINATNSTRLCTSVCTTAATILQQNATTLIG